jgi:hypothetical protein
MDKVLTEQIAGSIARNLGLPFLAYLAARGLFPAEGANEFLAGVVSLGAIAWGLFANREESGVITQEAWFGMIRNLAAPWIAWAAGKGWVTADVAGWLVAGISSTSFAAWSVWAKWRAAQKK